VLTYMAIEGHMVLRHVPEVVYVSLAARTTTQQPSDILELPGLPAQIVPLYPISTTFAVKHPGSALGNQSRSYREIGIHRWQFPLVPSFATTDYKAQGATLDCMIADLSRPQDGRFNFANLYVMLSRVRRLSDLVLLQPLDDGVCRMSAPSEQIADEQRLLELSQKTRRTVELWRRKRKTPGS
jgi:hypothetical protein